MKRLDFCKKTVFLCLLAISAYGQENYFKESGIIYLSVPYDYNIGSSVRCDQNGNCFDLIPENCYGYNCYYSLRRRSRVNPRRSLDANLCRGIGSTYDFILHSRNTDCSPYGVSRNVEQLRKNRGELLRRQTENNIYQRESTRRRIQMEKLMDQIYR